MADEARAKELAEMREQIIADAKENWHVMDTDNDGQITFEEFFAVACGEKGSQDDKDKMKPIFDAIDTNSSGTINFEEYVEFKFKLESEE